MRIESSTARWGRLQIAADVDSMGVLDAGLLTGCFD